MPHFPSSLGRCLHMEDDGREPIILCLMVLVHPVPGMRSRPGVRIAVCPLSVTTRNYPQFHLGVAPRRGTRNLSRLVSTSCPGNNVRGGGVPGTVDYPDKPPFPFHAPACTENVGYTQRGQPPPIVMRPPEYVNPMGRLERHPPYQRNLHPEVGSEESSTFLRGGKGQNEDRIPGLRPTPGQHWLN